MKKTAGQQWYQNRVENDPHWERMKNIAYDNLDEWKCAINRCNRRANLQWHHLTYLRLGSPVEWKDIVPLCGSHHYLCHYRLFGKVPMTGRELSRRYRELNSQRWRRIRPNDIFNLFSKTYVI